VSLCTTATPADCAALIAPGCSPRCRGWAGLVNLTILTLLLSCLCVPFSAARVSAGLSGMITDQSVAVVPVASVIATNLDTGISRTVPTDQSGRHRFFALPVGLCQVRVTKQGFAEAIDRDYTSRSGKMQSSICVCALHKAVSQ
jgi:hypothetical protein